MIRTLLLAPLLLLGAVLPPPVAGNIRTEILDTENARLAAFRAADKDAFAKLVTDDLIMVHSDGGIADKLGEMSNMRASTPDRPLPTLAVEQPIVRGYGDTAVLVASLVERRDGRVVLRLRFTNTYVRTGGHWRLASGQMTRASNG